jgi:hypothetical protein
MRNLFEILNEKLSKYYNPSEYLVVDGFIFTYNGRVIFRQYIPKIHERSGTKIYKLFDETGYRYVMIIYLFRDTVYCATSDCNSNDSVIIDNEYTRTWPETDNTSPPSTYSLTCLRKKFTVVALSDSTGRACHNT